MNLVKFLLSNPRYFRHFIGNVCSQMGDWIRNITLMFIVLSLSHNSPKAVSINMFCEFAPMLLAPFVGVFVDRWDRKRTLIGATISRAIILLIVAVGLYENSLLIIYGCAVVGSLCTVFNQSATSGFVMQMVPKEERRTASSLTQVAASAAILVGPAIGAGLYTWIGPIKTIVFVTALFCMQAFLIASIKVDRYERADVTGGIGAVLKEMKEGFVYAKGNRTLRALLLGSWAMGLAVGVINVLEVFLITEFLGLPQSMLATLLMIQGIGMLVSVPIIQKLNWSLRKLFTLSLIISGLGMCGMVAYKSFLTTSIAYLIMSFGNIGLNISIGTLMQTKVAMEYQGRANAMLNMALMGSIGIFMLLGGWAHAYLSLTTLFIICGISSILFGIWMNVSLGSHEQAKDDQQK